MKHRALGRSGLKVCEIAYGSWISHTEGSAAAVAREALEHEISTMVYSPIGPGSNDRGLSRKHIMDVASAIVGASTPEQVIQNASASGIELDDDTAARVDEIVERDPAKTPADPTDYYREDPELAANGREVDR